MNDLKHNKNLRDIVGDSCNRALIEPSGEKHEPEVGSAKNLFENSSKVAKMDTVSTKKSVRVNRRGASVGYLHRCA